jgi:aspartyl-tRNA(Asn)/glutamyl-tRNA(Gln) amidotransferase subunit A
MTGLWRQDATTLGGLLDNGAVSPVAVLDQCLARIARLEPALNAFMHLDPDGARRAAEASAARQAAGARLGPLDGIPVAVKDNLYVAGMPARWGSLLFRDHVADRDDICVERLRAAGAVIVGKTATPEFALSGRTESRLSGVTRNPWNPELTPGGSSGGAVAAVASGMVPLALGTDAGGSTRMPAGYTGLVGLRPSNGRIPRRYGFPPMAVDFQAIGTFTRTVRDHALLLGAVAGPDARDPASLRLPPSAPLGRPPRIGWFTAIGEEQADDAVAESVSAALRHLAGQGCDVVPCAAPFDLALLREVWGVLTAAGAARVARRFPETWRTETTPVIAATVERGLALPATAYVEALDKLATFRAELSAGWGAYDALAMPTTPAPAWPADADAPAEIGGRTGNGATQGMFCGWVNAAGYPGISVPAAPHPDGRPIGLQLVAPFGGDALLLDLAARLEAAAGWADRWPALAEEVTS